MIYPTYDFGTEEYLLNEVRIERNELLKQSDWTQFSDSPLTAEKKAEWATYRQALRDITVGLTVPTNQKGYPILENINWPTKPE